MKEQRRYPEIERAKELLADAERCNPGPWGNHSRYVADCATKIAKACGGLEEEKAYVLGLLHDIGRKFGGKHLGHVYDGYTYMMNLGYSDVARVCLSHSFNDQRMESYIGTFDITPEEEKVVSEALSDMVFDEYDWLIQLCDALAGAEGVVDIEERMSDVKRRYGTYPQEKWDRNFELKTYFEQKMGKDLYEVVR